MKKTTVKHETVSKTSNKFAIIDKIDNVFFVSPTDFFCKIDVLLMTTRVFIISLNTKSMTRKKNGFVKKWFHESCFHKL